MGFKFSNVFIVGTILLGFCLLTISLASPIETNEIINSGDDGLISQQTEENNGNSFDLLWERDDTPNEKETRKKENNKLLNILIEILKTKSFNKENEAKFVAPAAYLVNSNNNDSLLYQDYYDYYDLSDEYDITVNETTYIF